MDKLYIVVPAYNESANVRRLIEEWYPIIEKYGANNDSRLVVIDDGSKDNTYELLCELAKDHPLLKPMTKPNGGHGETVLYGYRYAIENSADYVFQTDSDGQTNPKEFYQFWENRKDYDAIIGKRLVRGDGAQRKFVENVVCALLYLIFGVKIQDANAPYRLMRTSLLEKYISRLPKNFNIPNIMFTTYFVYFHEKVKFIEITFKPRQGGVNSINVNKIIKIGWKALGDFWKLRIDINK